MNIKARLSVVALALALAAAGAVVIVVSQPAAEPSGQAGGRPNLILISSDDQRTDDMIAMPQTQKLIGRAGTTFTRAYATFPLCCPSRASIMTGQYAHNHGVLGNGGNGVGGFQAFDNSSTLATWLHDAGYSTNFVGKYLNRYGQSQPVEVPVGWDEWHATVGGGDYFNTRLFEDGTPHEYNDMYQTDLDAGIATDLITRRAASDTPFFLWASFYAPHSGVPAEEDDPANGIHTPAVASRYRDAFAGEQLPEDPSYDEADVSDKPAAVADLPRLGSVMRDSLTELRQQRLESLLSLDDAIKGMFDALEASGELDNTIVIFTSDNGYMLGEHRIHAGKTVPYEPSARVPMLARGPGFPAGAVRDQPVALVDLAPTFVQAAGASAGLAMDGVSLLPPAQDPQVGADRVLLLEAGPDTPDGPIKYTGVRTYRYVYVEYADGERELYDLVEDPYELENLAADPTAPARDLMGRLAAQTDRLQDCAGTSCQLG